LFRLLCANLALLILAGCTASQPPAARRPNILIIISDDQRYDEMMTMPHTQDLIFNQGITFDHAYVTTPQCCPSRSSILTGMYAHHHGVLTNDMRLTQTTMVQRLHQSGYFTGIVGKYLNSYPLSDDPPLPEFDYWVSMPDKGTNGAYFDPYLNVNGV